MLPTSWWRKYTRQLSLSMWWETPWLWFYCHCSHLNCLISKSFPYLATSHKPKHTISVFFHLPNQWSGSPSGHILALDTYVCRTKRELPTVARVETTIKNINWLLIYWKCIQPAVTRVPDTPEERETLAIWDHSVCFPDAVSQEFGFKRATRGKGAVQWLDTLD
jgi:hypothetical protein